MKNPFKKAKPTLGQRIGDVIGAGLTIMAEACTASKKVELEDALEELGFDKTGFGSWEYPGIKVTIKKD
jgi:hypothetical protein